jgi:hypothetical protein
MQGFETPQGFSRQRVETQRWAAFRSHYGLEVFYCQPGIGGAHEKGGVEGQIGWFRRNHLVPVPNVDSLAELNAMVDAWDTADDTPNRHPPAHYRRALCHRATAAPAAPDGDVRDRHLARRRSTSSRCQRSSDTGSGRIPTSGGRRGARIPSAAI